MYFIFKPAGLIKVNAVSNCFQRIRNSVYFQLSVFIFDSVLFGASKETQAGSTYKYIQSFKILARITKMDTVHPKTTNPINNFLSTNILAKLNEVHVS